ncbi:hypothetical protein DUI87_12264 [Hirundo rustica rustica]|uniref:Uncharacterized protein n=1 Tax=Hirundo rustica rustica TaxID=333673 RepID=A0A3M0KD26_HIRRU|nr:hypothetical protein DUI87_12264 [Hirundo rustica rustica]
MEPRELLEALVAVVATLGQLVATVAGPDGDVLLSTSPRSLHTALEIFISHLHCTLGHPGVTSLGQALAALGATLGATWARVTAAASAWRNSVAALGDSWAQLAKEATELCDACRDVATTEATAAATATARARDQQDQAASWETAGDNLVAVAWQVPLALSKDKVESALAAHEARMAAASDELVAATKAKEEAVVATNQAGVATSRELQVEVAQGPLKSLVAACDKAKAFPQELQRQLRDIEAALEGTRRHPPMSPRPR